MTDYNVTVMGHKVPLTVKPDKYRPSAEMLKLMAAYLYGGDKNKAHLSSNVRGAPAGTKGYFHDYSQNDLVAFGDYTIGELNKDGTVKTKASVTVTADGDMAKNNVHNFKKKYK